MQQPLLSFPETVNDVAARTVAAGVVAMVVVALATRQLWITIPLGLGFVARVASGPRFSPLGLFATRVVAPRLPGYEKIVPGPPKRFAQSIGVLFSIAACSLWLLGHAPESIGVLTALGLAATLEAGFGVCVGCRLFALGMRVGLIPESVCEQCIDLSGLYASRRGDTDLEGHVSGV